MVKIPQTATFFLDSLKREDLPTVLRPDEDEFVDSIMISSLNNYPTISYGTLSSGANYVQLKSDNSTAEGKFELLGNEIRNGLKKLDYLMQTMTIFVSKSSRFERNGMNLQSFDFFIFGSF